MIPQIKIREDLDPLYHQYLQELENNPQFHGEIRTDLSTRLVAAVDNSIYQVLPQAVVFPRSAADISLMFGLAQQPAYVDLTFSPRGGGTGTNGQSLSTGLIIDTSKYMN